MHWTIENIYRFVVALLITAAILLTIGWLTSCANRVPPERDFSNLKRLSDSIENAEKAGDYYGQ